MEMVARHSVQFSLYREEGGAMVEGVENFKYLGQNLDQTDDDWPSVRKNIMRARLVWGRLGTLMRREGEEPRVLEIFDRAVAQAVLLFGSETWVPSAAMERNVDVIYTCFLQNITGTQAHRIADRTWETPGEEVVQEAAGTKFVMTYIGR